MSLLWGGRERESGRGNAFALSFQHSVFSSVFQLRLWCESSVAFLWPQVHQRVAEPAFSQPNAFVTPLCTSWLMAAFVLCVQPHSTAVPAGDLPASSAQERAFPWYAERQRWGYCTRSENGLSRLACSCCEYRPQRSST